MMILAILIAIGIPAVFLFVIYTLDLYASRTFRLVLVAFAWGALGAFGISFSLNQYVGLPLLEATAVDTILLLTIAFAPVVEEIAKSLSLLYISRQREFTYFVDGAIYGFAAGIGFSIIENFLYLSQNPELGLFLALIRGFSTCLMHGTAAGLVGAAVGRSRFRRRSGRQAALVAGWIVAIILHAIYNGIPAIEAAQSYATIIAVAIGLTGVAVMVAFILRGLAEQREWIAETLDEKMRVTQAEVKAVQSLASIEDILEPIAGQFPAKAKQIEQLLLFQAQLGIKRKVQLKSEDAEDRERLDEEITRLRTRVEQLQREIGLYAMTFVRQVFPEGVLDIWAQLIERMTGQDGAFDAERWVESLRGTQADGASDQSWMSAVSDKLADG